MTARRTFTVASAAAQLGVTPDHVYRLIRSGHIPVVKNIGRRRLIPAHVLDEMLGLPAE